MAARSIFAGSEQHLLSEMFFSSAKPFYNSADPLNLKSLDIDVYTYFVKLWMDRHNKSINMVDGIDGLSSGFCIIIFTLFSCLLFKSHDFVRAAIGMTIVGGLFPFFVMNVYSRKSKMFIGEAGAMMLGIAICDFVMAILTKDSLSARHHF